MDLVALPRLSGLRGLSLPRVLRGVLRRRVPGTARQLLGDASAGRAAELPQLGPAAAQPDLQRHPLREGRMTIAIDVHLDAVAAEKMAGDVREGLCSYPKEVALKYFYDERGSLLFEQITELPEYYPTRAER